MALVSQCLVESCRVVGAQDVDSYSWHCGCPVLRGTKWAANSWVWNQPQQGPPFAQRRASLSNTPDRTVQSELWVDENGTNCGGGGKVCWFWKHKLTWTTLWEFHFKAMDWLQRQEKAWVRTSSGKRHHVPDSIVSPGGSTQHLSARLLDAWRLDRLLAAFSLLEAVGCSIADAQLRKELQIIWKRNMATSKACSFFYLYSLPPSHVFPFLFFWCFFVATPCYTYIGTLCIRVRAPWTDRRW